MRKEIKTVVYDDELRLEAYRFEGVVQPFPNHFHEYYVIGFVEGGERCLSCRNQEYTIGKGNVILFNPGDSHACVQTDDGTLDYRGFNITKEVMLDFAEEVTGKRELPGFSQTVICDEDEQACAFMEEHFTERIYLDQICRHAGLSKSTLLRAFTKSKGVTPYCYLENIRIGAAKKC